MWYTCTLQPIVIAAGTPVPLLGTTLVSLVQPLLPLQLSEQGRTPPRSCYKRGPCLWAWLLTPHPQHF